MENLYLVIGTNDKVVLASMVFRVCSHTVAVAKYSGKFNAYMHYLALRKKCPYSELFRIQSKCRKMRGKYGPEYLRIRTLFMQR